MSDENKDKPEEMKKVEGKPSKPRPIMELANELNDALYKSYQDSKGKSKGPDIAQIVRAAAGSATNSKKTVVPRLAFQEDPISNDHYMGLFRNKKRLLPDYAIKRIRTENHLIAAILRARGNAMSMFGRIRKDRFDVGLECEVKDEFKEILTSDELIKIQERIDAFLNILINCGRVDGLAHEDKMLLSEFMDLSCRNGLSFGRFASEIIYDNEGNFHRFRPVDAGTIYRAVRRGEYADSIRRASLALLEEIQGIKIDIKAM